MIRVTFYKETLVKQFGCADDTKMVRVEAMCDSNDVYDALDLAESLGHDPMKNIQMEWV